MMNRNQDRALRKICRQGGKLTLPTTDGPLTIEVTLRQRTNHPDRADAKISESPTSFLKLNDWSPRELYADLAERIEDQYQVLSEADDAPEVQS
ncbi:hypothetical protein QO259_05525 [Salinicola sp. JS01]|uniref:hypothetical protein n=1 Tax=Salinicola sp. JS01 TaxID=3050071 RepID=UPI00255C024C|nr:hypothetical protein [Salinicola sp. JS01]WIX34122.1 hypothetical protein QO259_05525 [Salinicola sp. JS01]